MCARYSDSRCFVFPKADTDCPYIDIAGSSDIKLSVKMVDHNARRDPNKEKTSAWKGIVISPSARLRNDTGRKDLCEKQPRVKRDRTPAPRLPRRVYLKCARVEKEDLS